MAFVKLHGTIIDSSVWSEDSNTRIVWITLLAKADRHGCVHASLPGLARAAVVPLADVERALAIFSAPDPHSRSPEFDGRRIEPMDGGWRLLNYQKYREMQSESAARMREWRERQNSGKGPKASHVTSHPSQGSLVDEVTAEAEAEADTGVGKIPITPPVSEAARFARWWAAYPGPRKTKKADCWKKWQVLKKRGELPAIDVMLAKLELQKASYAWTKDDGQFVPGPLPYLNGKRWDDEVAPPPRRSAAQTKHGPSVPVAPDDDSVAFLRRKMGRK